MKLRSHFLPRLTNAEAEEYLENNDAIIVPVGTVEMHGGFPLDVETVVSEAFAMKMAEKANCLILPNLPYFYAGATAVGRGTVEVSSEDGIRYLKAVIRSLIRQGFRRIILLSLHGPAHITCSPVVRDLGDETGAPVLYIDMMIVLSKYMKELAATVLNKEDLSRDEYMNLINDIFYGGYLVMGRLEDVPLTYRPELDFSREHACTADRFDFLSSLTFQSGGFSYFFQEALDHAPTPFLAKEEDRLAHALTGVKAIEFLAERMNVPHILEQQKELEEYNLKARKKCGTWLTF